MANVQGWDKDQRALQMVSYLDEKAMNVAQELSDQELYDYDTLVGLLSARFDPASRVSASRSRFHGRTRCHQEDAGHICRRDNRVMSTGLSTKLTRASPKTYQ